MKRDINNRFIKKNIVESLIPSLSFLIKYLSILFILLPWIYLAMYKINIGKIFEKALFYLFGDPIACENGKFEKIPYY